MAIRRADPHAHLGHDRRSPAMYTSSNGVILAAAQPTHLHPVEEILTVLEGSAEVWIEDEHASMTVGQSVIVPAGHRHGFRNIGETTLHMEATLAAPISRLPLAKHARDAAMLVSGVGGGKHP